MTARQYNDPAGGTDSSIGGDQIRTDFYKRKALTEARKQMAFMPLSSVENMPKHYGKKIKLYHYLPLLDDRNINDQGIDANGASTTREVTIQIDRPDELSSVYNSYYAVGEAVFNTDVATTDADALTAAQAEAVTIFKNLGVFNLNYATTKTDVEALGWTVTELAAVNNGGNLYGSSKDVGYINGRLPTLTENGGRVNRVGFTRIQLESNLEKFGFFDEYTQESVDFDSDAMLMEHVTREMINGAVEITEDTLQIDLLNAAGVVRYGGTATSKGTLSGETGGVTLLTYDGLMRMAIDLDNNRCPKHTRMITGTRMIDTKVIDSARILYIGSELIPVVKQMTDSFGNQAFIPVQHYAAGGSLYSGNGSFLPGEIGTIDQFRIVVNQEMMHWEGHGELVATNDGYRTGVAPVGSGADHAGSEAYNVYPALCVGDSSFTTIGFARGGKEDKFTIYHKKPGREIADRNDPYGEVGFMSIKWYYGILITRPERIALYLSVAPR